MSKYTIYTDSACDIPPVLLKKWQVRLISMSFRFDDRDRIYRDNELPPNEFYARMRSGAAADTFAINTEEYVRQFEGSLVSGSDVLYIAVSSRLSLSYGNAVAAAYELNKKYPGRRIEVVDSLSASAGQGILVYLTAVQQKRGRTLDETIKFVSENRLRICNWSTVGEIEYLRRGGRIDPTVSVAGKLLGVKPVLYIDSDGRIVNAAKARSRKTAIRTIAEKYGHHVSDRASKVVLIAHAGCRSDAEELSAILRKEYRVSPQQILDIGSAVGAHSGPDTLTLSFISDSPTREI